MKLSADKKSGYYLWDAMKKSWHLYECSLFAACKACNEIRDLLFKYFTPKLGIEQMNKVYCKIEM